MELYLDKEKCYGCSLCSEICPVNAIEMTEDEKGFLYPRINYQHCLECGKCVSSCPIKHEEVLSVETVFALKHAIEKERKSSQSGGAFYAMAQHILKLGGVVYGCILNEKFMPEHIRTETPEGLRKMKGSKYVQSDMRNIYSQIKNDVKKGRWVLVSGTSCQIQAVRMLLKNLDCNKVILVDLICHGVPSPKLWGEHVEYLQKKLKGRIEKIACRDTQFYTWGKNIEVVTYIKNQKLKYYHNRGFAGIFYSNQFLRPSCYSCKYKNGNFTGDITIADFWGIDKILPDFNDDRGISLVLIHDKKGSEFLKNTENIILIESDLSKWKEYQMKKPAVKYEDNDQYWREYFQKGYKYIVKKYGGESFVGRIKMHIKNWSSN